MTQVTTVPIHECDDHRDAQFSYQMLVGVNPQLFETSKMSTLTYELTGTRCLSSDTAELAMMQYCRPEG
eukprot:6816415-Karenia_brevis.AAC.1